MDHAAGEAGRVSAVTGAYLETFITGAAVGALAVVALILLAL